MKATLLPVYFPQEKTERFETQLERLRTLLGEVAEFLPPQPIDAPAPKCDAVVFPEIVGEAYRRTEDFRRLPLPFLIATSEFGTLSMWDWEVINFLKVHNLPALAPYNLEQARLYCRMLAMRGTLRGGKFLVFQDNPGDGFQPEIFKSFFWWGEGCTQAIEEKFGLTIERRSLKKLGSDALAIPDSTALDEW
ncbi:MAG: hypothetical protein LBU79_03490 [Planctomycetota bacterium]|jgi:hypothetical protein|nr:hypothetical protein [Planctomycetota bacterium]